MDCFPAAAAAAAEKYSLMIAFPSSAETSTRQEKRID